MRRSRWPLATDARRRLAPAVGHGREEVLVGLGLRHPREQQLHRLYGRERREDLAEDPHAIQILFRDQQLFLPRAALLDVDRGEDAAVGELPIQMDLEV